MASVLKCKMCGGDIVLSEDKTLGICDSCGSTTTFPRVSDEKRVAAFNRGNFYRRTGEFDKALSVYEQIILEDDNDAEAHWCAAISRYGIEYVEDPISMEYFPTCHRASFDSFLDDIDVKAALEHSEGSTHRQYLKEANKISEVQKGILATSLNEEPFDIFICYKETDDLGQRTQDSVLAQDIFLRLVDEGFKVFFSRITLEDKVGSEYEPYIFAALNSAKVMIVVGTKKEYLESVWVKNEWSRFISLMKKDRSRVVLPCYKDMNPYDMPQALSALQSYDMSAIGFVQDLLRGIKKIIDISGNDKTKVVVEETVNTDALMKRGLYELEYKEWDNAKSFFDQVLNHAPENGDAYIGLLMAELCVSKFKDLEKSKKRFDNSNEYKKAIRFADPEVAEQLKKYARVVNDAITDKNKRDKYDSAKSRFDSAVSDDEFKSIAIAFKELGDYQDSLYMARECEKRIAEIVSNNSLRKENKKKRAKKCLTIIIVGAVLVGIGFGAFSYINKVIIPEKKYRVACELMEKNDFDGAIVEFDALSDYKDSKDKILECERRKAEEHFINAEVGDYVTFGLYEQDNDTSNGREDIEWRVIDKENDRILIISKYALDCLQYNEIGANITWENCSLRKWLNDSFLRNAFSNKDESVILNSTVSAHMNPDYNSANPGNDTIDQVFLLSVREARELFEDNKDRVCIPTSYAIAQGASTSDSYEIEGKGACEWWLRTPGFYAGSAANVYSDGSVAGRGDGVNRAGIAVRPVLWIDTSLLSIYK